LAKIRTTISAESKAASKTDALQVAVWTPANLPEMIALSRFTLSPKAHEVLLEWCREKTGRHDRPVTLALRGLSDILAFLVPETACMRLDAFDDGSKRLSLYFLGNALSDQAIPTRIRTAMSIWLGILYPNKTGDVRGFVAEAADDQSNWTDMPVATGLRAHNGVCAVPINAMLYDALAAMVARHLAGQIIRFASGHERTLVLQTPRSSLFRGVELVAFPPTKERDGDGLWSEVVTISTASFPERNGIHILARTSIRNWGPIRGYDIPSSPSRSLDVFMPSEIADGGYANYRHASFPFKALDANWPERRNNGGERRIVARWESDDSQRVFDLVGRLAGARKLADTDLASPIVGEEGRWVLPRLSPGGGNRYLSGASGVGWSDRRDIVRSLDQRMQQIGFAQAEPMHRLKRQLPLKGPFNNVPADDRDEAKAQRRAILAKTMELLGGNGNSLDIVVFRLLEATPASVIEEIGEYLGAPHRVAGYSLRWDEGLTINIVPALSGPLAEKLPRAVLTETEKNGKSPQQRDAIVRSRQSDLNSQIAATMREHIRSTRNGRSAIGCALLEMAASHKGQRSADPYAMARSELASERLLPQVLLVGQDESVEDDGPSEGKKSYSKIRAAVRDLFRMLGVMPFAEDNLPWIPAAIGIIQRNSEPVGGGRIQSQAFPLAMRIKDGILQCALPGETGDPNWMPYAEAALFIFSGIHERFARNRFEENIAKFNTFFSAALEQINRVGPAIVLADLDTLSDKFKSIQNGNLAFDRLEIGNRVLTPSDLRNIRVIRLSTNSEKLPTYYHDETTQWPTGLFIWGDRVKRTAYALKRKPVSAKSIGRSSLVSRHLDSGDNRAIDDRPRRASAIDEVCVIFCQAGDDLGELRLAAHRLRGTHAQYDDDTRSPFPLHELRLLGRAVTS